MRQAATRRPEGRRGPVIGAAKLDVRRAVSSFQRGVYELRGTAHPSAPELAGAASAALLSAHELRFAAERVRASAGPGRLFAPLLLAASQVTRLSEQFAQDRYPVAAVESAHASVLSIAASLGARG